MNVRSAALRATLPLLLAVVSFGSVLAAPAKPHEDKPSISVKAAPAIGFAPFRVVLTADVRGGPDDYEQFYCASIEWDMGDGNKSEQQIDCDPYEAGKSQITRRYVKNQVFDMPGEFKIQFRLKQKDKIVGVGNTTIRVRPGLRDGGLDDRDK